MDQIIGQHRALEVLQSAFVADRLHHAYIFHGPQGIGKFTTAVSFAKVLLCHEAITDHQAQSPAKVGACGACASCRLLQGLESSTHPDLHVVNKELARFSKDPAIRNRKLTSLPVDVLRTALIDPVYRAPQLGHRKIFIVDDADLMQPMGQNLLLKTLEEPPQGTIIFLITSSEDRLLATIRSRCQRVGFSPLGHEAVQKWLQLQKVKVAKEHRDWWLDFADGSLGRVQLGLQYGIADWGDATRTAFDAMARGQYPVDYGSQIAGQIDDFAKQWVDKHDNASKDAANRQGVGLMWSVINLYACRQLRNQANQGEPGESGAAEEKFLPWLEVIEALHTTEQEIASNVNMGLVADHLVSLMYQALNPGRNQIRLPAVFQMQS